MVTNSVGDVGGDIFSDENDSLQNDDPDDDISVQTDLGNYQPWELDTTVLMELPNGWSEGFITDFQLSSPKTVVYEVTWNDGEVITYTDIKEVDEMVTNAEEYEPWEAGTPVYEQFGDGNEVGRNGFISSFVNGQYVISWDDGTSQNYFDFDTVDDFVFNARGNGEGESGMDDGEADSESESGGNIWDGYEPWGNGTPVSYEFDDGWWEGEISGYKDGVYEVTWINGSTNRYGDFGVMDKMVANARISLPDTGAGDEIGKEESIDDNVQDASAEDNTIGDSNIGSEENDVDDDIQDTIDEDDDIGGEERVDDDLLINSGMDAEQVEIVNLDETEGRVYENGTMVCKKFDDGWWVGFVESFEGGTYTIKWADDGINEYEEGEEMDQMVTDAHEGPVAADSDPYPVGTIVYVKNSDVWYEGSIKSYEKFMYTVVWEDGNETYYVDGTELDHIVANGVKVAEDNDDGLAAGGKVGIAIAAVSVSFLIGLVLVKSFRRKNRSSKQSRRIRYDIEGAERINYGLPRIA
jgi:hypothetical protein